MNNNRLKILSKPEINELYDIPQFTANEQKNYFSLSKKEFKKMSGRGTLASKVHFIQQVGYFKATSQFFDCKFYETKNDVDYILQEYFENTKLSANTVSQKTGQTNQELIAGLLDFQIDKSIVKNKLVKMLEIKSRLCSNPIYLFHEVLCFNKENKMLLLVYSTIQDLIGAAITGEENRLSDSLKKHLSSDNWKNIENTISKYEFMIYRLISDQIETGHVYLANSISFKSLTSHLVNDEKWKDKLQLLKQLGNRKLLMPVDKLFDDLESTLEKLIVDVNKRIENGENKGIKIKKEGEEITFTLPYPTSADKENNPIFK
ncbi:MAG: DUF4158 domain-containing protein [Coxiellaceae bacterium]|nr:DUF4158 domain-containing protein [Coxiellaceae bacterium]